MTKRLLKTGVILSAFLLPSMAKAQADIHFSQFYETAILRNPAMVGVFESDYKAGVMYRNQWSTITNPYQTAMLNVEGRFAVSHASSDFISVGLLGYYDKAGSVDQKITGVYPVLNYNLCLNSDNATFLSAGFTGGYLQYSFDPSKATYNNQYQNGFDPNASPGETLPNPRMTMWDLGAGLNFNTVGGEEKDITYMIGVAGYHLTQPPNSYYRAPNMNMAIRWNVNAGLSKQASDKVVYQFHLNAALQGKFREFIGGGLIGWNALIKGGNNTVFTIYAGAFYRYNDAIIPIFKLRYKDLSFGFSYDVNVSTLKAASAMRGGYEITLVKTGFFPSNSAAAGKVMCPRF